MHASDTWHMDSGTMHRRHRRRLHRLFTLRQFFWFVDLKNGTSTFTMQCNLMKVK